MKKLILMLLLASLSPYLSAQLVLEGQFDLEPPQKSTLGWKVSGLYVLQGCTDI